MADPQPLENATELPPRRSLLWPGLIIGLLAVHVTMALVMVFVATRDRSFAVEPDYYQKALHWDEFSHQRQENARLAWKITLHLEGPADVLGRRRLVCRLQDAAGKPLEGAAIDLVAFAHTRATERIAAVCTPRAAGEYQTTLRFARGGLWEFRLVVRRGPNTFTTTQPLRLEDR